MISADNIDRDEIRRFAAMAEIWWDRDGEFKALHDINPVRLAYVRDRTDVGGKTVLDVGCGGGLLAEALAAAGARVTGIDMAETSLAVARAHMVRSGLSIDYRQTTAERHAAKLPDHYDVAVCMELLEHVPRPASVVAACARLVRPGGDLFFATVNRTWLAWLLVIVAAEQVMGIVRKGTHEYAKLIRPDELRRWGVDAGLRAADLSGLRYIPFGGHASLCRSTAMNYLMHFKRPSVQRATSRPILHGIDMPAVCPEASTGVAPGGRSRSRSTAVPGQRPRIRPGSDRERTP